MIHGYGAVGVPVRGGADLEHGVVQSVGQRPSRDNGENRGEECSSQPRSEVGHRGVGHEAKL